jgi:threonine/homoserine/homoserine lactone efflux protein
MIPLHDLLLFAAGALLLVLSPGPNMIYLISRSICQGRTAGVISLAGVVLDFWFTSLRWRLDSLRYSSPFRLDTTF